MTGNGSKALRRYNVRTAKDRWLALIVISDDGFLGIVSDYGNYAFAWTHAGEEFRTFLASLGTDYLLGKLCGRREVYQPAETLRHVKKTICEQRREGSFDRDDARKEWDLLVEHNDLEASEDFSAWLSDTSIGDAFEMASHDYPADARGFASTVWPVFAAMLRTEIAAEQPATVLS